MSIAINFDSLKFIRTLTDAGIPQQQAEAQVEAFKIAHEENLDCLATKQDLKDLKQELKDEIKDIRQELKGEIKDVRQEIDLKCSLLKTDLIKWVLSIVFS